MSYIFSIRNVDICLRRMALIPEPARWHLDVKARRYPLTVSGAVCVRPGVDLLPSLPEIIGVEMSRQKKNYFDTQTNLKSLIRYFYN